MVEAEVLQSILTHLTSTADTASMLQQEAAQRADQPQLRASLLWYTNLLLTKHRLSEYCHCSTARAAPSEGQTILVFSGSHTHLFAYAVAAAAVQKWKPSMNNQQNTTFQKLKRRVFRTNLNDVYSYLTATLQYYISFGITAARSCSPVPASFPFYFEVHTNSW